MALALTPTTSSSTLSVLQRKVQEKVLDGINRKSPEYRWAKNLPNADMDFSAREVTQPITVTRQGGGAFIEEFGYEADPRTVAPQELTFVFTHYNDRFALSMFARNQDKHNRSAMLTRQLAFQTMRMAEGLTRRFTYTFYGFSTGLVCQTSTNATSATQTLTLINAFGLTEAAADNASYLGQMFAVGDRIAVVRTGAILTNGLGKITAVSETTPSIAVTMEGSCDVDANDEIYYAQSTRDDTADVNSCDLNKWPVGLLDATNSTSFHGLSSGTYPGWGVAYSDTAGARMNGTRLMRGMDEIANRDGSEGPYTFIHTQGIKRDIFNQQVAAVRFADPMNMRLDGAVKVGEGINPLTSRFVPPGRAWLLPKDAYRKWWLTPMPDEDGELPDWNDNTQVDKIENRSGFYVSVNATWGNVIKRNAIAAWSGLTES